MTEPEIVREFVKQFATSAALKLMYAYRKVKHATQKPIPTLVYS